MDRISIRYVFDRKKESNNSTKQGLLQVEVRLTGTSKKVFISTGIKLFKNQFSKKDGFTCKNHVNENHITTQGRNIYNKIQRFALSDRCKHIEDVKKWNASEDSLESVTAFMEEQYKLEPVRKNDGNFNSCINRLKQYGKIKYFKDLTYENIEGFDNHLRKEIQSQPTLYKRHGTLNHFIKIAIRKGLCNYNPYDDFIVKKGKHKDPKFLLEADIENLLNYDPHKGGLELMPIIKDLFIFQCFTGMPYSNMQKFKKEDIFLISGYKTIRSSRVKTDEGFVSLLLPEAEKIADKYNYSLPKISIQEYNKYLKTLAAGANINIPLSSHMARHKQSPYQLLINKLHSLRLEIGNDLETSLLLRYA
ncbi:MAG: phage integrase SAM-like domain-containing protein [Dysgonomonas sp.]|nr:phage integrase SAM-like domain-containing protein [Dysgonomonas sp.]